MSQQEHTVPNSIRSEFLNKYAPKVFQDLASKAKAKIAIGKGEIKVNGSRVNYDHKVVSGDKITFSRSTKSKTPARKVFEEKLNILFEDNEMAVVFKPGGLPVNGNSFKTLENALPFNLKVSQSSDALPFPRPVHRLDAPTTGLVLIAKTEKAQVDLGQQLQTKKISKRYKAVIIGQLPQKTGEINSPIDKKPSITKYEVLKSHQAHTYPFISLVDLYPVTGRTHQLRIHMKEQGCPIIGDKLYGEEYKILQGKGLLLCSDQITFIHPKTGESTTVNTNIPNKFEKYYKRETR